MTLKEKFLELNCQIESLTEQNEQLKQEIKDIFFEKAVQESLVRELKNMIIEMKIGKKK